MKATYDVPRTLSQQCWQYEREVPGGIVVGVDGSPESLAALNTGAAIARRWKCSLHVMMVLAPFPSYRINPGAKLGADDIEQLRVSIKDAELRELLESVEPEETWTRQVTVGDPARLLVSVAERRGADLIVVGRSHHGVMDRIAGGETALKAMRRSTVPVVAVSEEIDRPKAIVVATDFLESSTSAAKLALELLGISGTLYLVHVDAPVELFPNGFALPGESHFPGDAIVRFRRLVGELGSHPGVLVQQAVLNGAPTHEIIEFARRVGADLIAAGTHSHSRLDRLLLGSVATGLVRNAPCGVLVMPGNA